MAMMMMMAIMMVTLTMANESMMMVTLTMIPYFGQIENNFGKPELAAIQM
jgi:hypothetical protein